MVKISLYTSKYQTIKIYAGVYIKHSVFLSSSQITDTLLVPDALS